MSIKIGDKVVYLEDADAPCYIPNSARGTVIDIRGGDANVNWEDDTTSQVMISNIRVVDLTLPVGTDVALTYDVYSHAKGEIVTLKRTADSDWDYRVEPKNSEDPTPFHISAVHISPLETALESESDAVYHPTHYNAHPSGVECIDLIRGLEFPIGNAVKYVWRAGLKDSDATEQDLDKALFYLNYAYDDALFKHYAGFIPADLLAKVTDSTEGVHKMFYMALSMYAGADNDGRYKAVDIMRKLIELMK